MASSVFSHCSNFTQRNCTSGSCKERLGMQSACMNAGPVVWRAGEAGVCGNLQMGTQTQMGAHTKGHRERSNEDCGFGLSTVRTGRRRHLCRLETSHHIMNTFGKQYRELFEYLKGFPSSVKHSWHSKGITDHMGLAELISTVTASRHRYL